MSLQPRSLSGVRLSRSGPIQFVESGEDALDIGQIVVVQRSPDELTGQQNEHGLALATVVMRSDQLLEAEVAPRPTGRVLRTASEEDIAAFGRRAAVALQVVAQTNTALAERGLDARAIDAWLSPDGAQLSITVDRPLDDVRALARQFARLFGRDVQLRIVGRPLTGVQAAGLALEDASWLALPDDPAAVRVALRPDGDPRAGTFIEGMFPLEERPRRRRDATLPHPPP